MDVNKNFMNPVLPSPWKSFAPVGCSGHLLRRRSYGRPFDLNKTGRVVVPQDQDKSRIREHQFLQQDSLFRNLNRCTLTLTFPGASRSEIDNVLAVCNNNLSEAIKILKSGSANKFGSPCSMPSSSQVRLSQTVIEPNTQVTYIPTRYKDVQIVELNTTPSNVKMFRLQNLTQIVPIRHVGRFIPILPGAASRAAVTPLQMEPVPVSAFPSSTDSSSSFEQFIHHTVENNNDKLQRNSVSPNQILERALTLYPPNSAEN